MIDNFATICVVWSLVEERDFQMSRSGCVVGWYPDPSVKGATSLKPVSCETVMEVLSVIVAKQALGKKLKKDEKAIVRHLKKNYQAGV